MRGFGATGWTTGQTNKQTNITQVKQASKQAIRENSVRERDTKRKNIHKKRRNKAVEARSGNSPREEKVEKKVHRRSRKRLSQHGQKK